MRSYICIDLKSFYASVECRGEGAESADNKPGGGRRKPDRQDHLPGRDPGIERTGRARETPGFFEVRQKVRELNSGRNGPAASCDKNVLDQHRNIRIDFIIAPPRMALYMDYSVRIYQIYLKYIAPEDIHVYSIDEVFMDVTDYLHTYQTTPHELALKIIKDVLKETGITATVAWGNQHVPG